MTGKKRGSNVFFVFGILFLAMVVSYRVAFYASYLYLEKDEIIFDWTGGEQNVWVSTDANSWIIEGDEFISWASFQKRENSWCIEYDSNSIIMIQPTEGKSLHVQVYQNDSKEDRVCHVRVRSGYVGGLGRTGVGLGNKSTNLKVIQRGKQATYLNASRQTISFSERGGTEKVQISTDGNGWSVIDCPNWITTSISGNTLVLTASMNNEMSPREGIVCINANGIEGVIKVLQNSLVQEKFTDFWKLFHGDPVFQKSRIKYPIPYVFYENEYDGTDEVQQTIRYIKETEWNYDEIYDNITFIEIVEKNQDSYIACRRGNGCGIYIDYYFELFNGKWYLTKVEDYSD